MQNSVGLNYFAKGQDVLFIERWRLRGCAVWFTSFRYRPNAFFDGARLRESLSAGMRKSLSMAFDRLSLQVGMAMVCRIYMLSIRRKSELILLKLLCAYEKTLDGKHNKLIIVYTANILEQHFQAPVHEIAYSASNRVSLPTHLSNECLRT